MDGTIVRIQFGSHLYGTSTPSSDLDFKAVHIPGPRDILLQRVQESVSVKRQKVEGEKNWAGEVDEENYAVQRYLELLAGGQTVAIDMLFAPKSSLLLNSELWSHIQQNRRSLLSKKSAAFVGYCRTQANKYGIKGSRVAAARDAVELFRAELANRGPHAKVGEIADLLTPILGEHSKIVKQQVNRDGDIGTFFECCNRKVDFTGTIKQAFEVYSRIHQNYGQRAQLAEKNEGVDWKALSHAVRVGREAIELLTTENITFPLADALHILEIKQGKLPYEAVAEEIESLLERVEDASQISALPETADHQFIDDLVASVYAKQICEPGHEHQCGVTG